jgi:hypothetical protein
MFYDFLDFGDYVCASIIVADEIFNCRPMLVAKRLRNFHSGRPVAGGRRLRGLDETIGYAAHRRDDHDYRSIV